MDRISEMQEVLALLWERRFTEHVDQIQTYYQTHHEEINKDFCSHIEKELMNKAISLQETGTLTEISLIAISYLHSSLITKTYDFEISMFSKLPFADENGIYAYWCPRFLYQFTDKDALFLTQELKKKFIRVGMHEERMVQKIFFAHYWIEAKKYFKLLVDNLVRNPKFKSLKISTSMSILYGEHMGNLERIS